MHYSADYLIWFAYCVLFVTYSLRLTTNRNPRVCAIGILKHYRNGFDTRGHAALRSDSGSGCDPIGYVVRRSDSDGSDSRNGFDPIGYVVRRSDSDGCDPRGYVVHRSDSRNGFDPKVYVIPDSYLHFNRKGPPFVAFHLCHLCPLAYRQRLPRLLQQWWPRHR